MDSNYNKNDYDTPIDSKIMLRDFLCFRTRFFFFSRIINSILRFSKNINKGKYSINEWCRESYYNFDTVEGCGGRIHIRNLNNITAVDDPVVFIGNHMSTMETFILPGLILPRKPITFVVKQSLVDMPHFGTVMKATEAIAVGRNNPIEDFKTVIKEGTNHIKAGTSVVIFPQSTRGPEFTPEEFNTIGIKLAKKAGVPIIPIALKTDFWGNGKLIKDIGPIDRKKDIYIEFGTPITIEGNGKKEHSEIIEFIQSKLSDWK
ncbi:MAG TPA: lysophospholipid acyltransferase family protein [Victivallales bacterium]|nr:lysophospholipid acyltransferase family protein [Victivallales bacterium]